RRDPRRKLKDAGQETKSPRGKIDNTRHLVLPSASLRASLAQPSLACRQPRRVCPQLRAPIKTGDRLLDRPRNSGGRGVDVLRGMIAAEPEADALPAHA